MEVVPQNLGERVFAVSVLIFAMVSFSSFVSSITNLMNHLRSLKSVETKQFAKLDRYLLDNGISFALSCRVKRYLDHWLAEAKRRPQEKDVEMLSKLSEPLRMEIHYESFRPILITHPFFSHYEEMNGKAMRKLCHTALKNVMLSAGDDLCHVGETAKAMYFVKTGELAYRRPFGHMTDKLEAGDWICEMVLWRPWEHAGTVTAVTESILMALDVHVFHLVVKETQTASKLSEEDAIAYAFKATNILAEVNLRDLTDLDDTGIFESRKIALEAFGDKFHAGYEPGSESDASGGFLSSMFKGFLDHTSSDGGRRSQTEGRSSQNQGRPDTGTRSSSKQAVESIAKSRQNGRRASEVEKAVQEDMEDEAVIQTESMRLTKFRRSTGGAPKFKTFERWSVNRKPSK
jgi:hypothetical protein